MAHHDRHPADEAELDRDEREISEEPRGGDEEEFDEDELDDEDFDEGDVGDEDIRAREAFSTGERFTDEVGSEGGSQGDLEVASGRGQPLSGSEADTTGRPARRDRLSFEDRQKGPGY